MIIDYSQNKDSIDISYVDEQNRISIETIKFDDSELKFGIKKQYHQFIECEDSDPERFQLLKSFYDNPIKLEKSKYFSGHNINYFFNWELKNLYPEISKKVHNLVMPDLFSVDIEIDITDKYGYSDETRAENPIRSISITDKNYNTLLLIVKNQKHEDFSVIDLNYIRSVLTESLGQYAHKYEYKFDIKQFDTESEMIKYFLLCINKYFHGLIGWNIYKYDMQYIYNRCERIGINYKISSPTTKLISKRIEINDHTHITIKLPAHRIVMDYMLLFKDSLIYNNLGKYSLDSIAEHILGLHKVSYDGNLRKLYEEDYLRFVGYALIDTILVMMLHNVTNLIGVEFFQSYYTGVPFLTLSQNSISEALVYQELMNTNNFLLESEFSNKETRKYEGGYVKNPTAKISESVSGFDFGSLYPNSMITVGLSYESKIDSIQTNAEGKPLTLQDEIKWKKYKELGYCLAPKGRIYDVSKDFLFTRIEKKLLNERKIFKGFMTEIYLNIIPKIEEEIKNRKLCVSKN